MVNVELSKEITIIWCFKNKLSIFGSDGPKHDSENFSNETDLYIQKI